jgi:dihydrofolate reductase
MPRLTVFNQITLDGYFTDAHGDIGWTHPPDDDAEFKEFVEENASGSGALLFGRKTYEMMASFCPTPGAAAQFPVVAARMNSRPKVVFSRTLAAVAWNNARLVADGLVEEVRRMKREGDQDITILGSGSVVAQLAEAGMIDEYQVLVFPLVLGEGRTMFDGMKQRLPLTLTRSRGFRDGRVFLVYELKA